MAADAWIQTDASMIWRLSRPRAWACVSSSAEIGHLHRQIGVGKSLMASALWCCWSAARAHPV